MQPWPGNRPDNTLSAFFHFNDDLISEAAGLPLPLDLRHGHGGVVAECWRGGAPAGPRARGGAAPSQARRGGAGSLLRQWRSSGPLAGGGIRRDGARCLPPGAGFGRPTPPQPETGGRAGRRSAPGRCQLQRHPAERGPARIPPQRSGTGAAQCPTAAGTGRLVGACGSASRRTLAEASPATVLCPV